MGAVLGLAAVVLLGVAGLWIGRSLGARTGAELALAAYVVAFAAIVCMTLLLSQFDGLTRAGLMSGCSIVFVAALGIRMLAGRPPSSVVPRPALRLLTRPGALTLLAVVVALAFSYVVALIVGTAPNGWDPLNYHLTRAALWLQARHVGYVDAAYDERINFNPPNGEIGFAFLLGLTRHENLAGFIQFASALACALGVFALSRRLGLRREAAAFGGLLFLTLPIVLLQSSGVKNDLVVASFLVAAAVFVVGRSRGEIALATLASALAVGTKFTAAYGLVILFLIALLAEPRRWRVARVIGLGVGTCIGAYWYLVNASETHHFLGDQSNVPGLTAPLHPRENLLNAYGLLVDFFDLSGSRGEDVLLYLAAAIVLAAALTVTRRGVRAGVGAGLIAASPLALLLIADHLGRPGLPKVYDALGEPQGYIAAGDAVASSPTTASDTGSWFGPVGFLLAVGIAIVAARRGTLPAAARVAAFAPALWFVLVALSLTYNPWEGRFFIFPMALSASLWGLVLRSRPLAWSAVAVAAVTAALSLVHYAEKPSGVRLVEPTDSGSVWDMQRWEVQSLHDPQVGTLFRFVDEVVPDDAPIGLALSANEFGYPVFGPHLNRRVVLLPFGSNGRELNATWLEADRSRAGEIDSACWRAAFRSDAGTVFRRASACGG